MHRLDFPSDEMVTQYRQVFSSRTGLEVFGHMLFDLGVLQQTQGERDVVLKNYGNHLLAILSGGEINLKEFTERIMRQPIPKE